MTLVTNLVYNTLVLTMLVESQVSTVECQLDDFSDKPWL